jgi:hypothetical protein
MPNEPRILLAAPAIKEERPLFVLGRRRKRREGKKEIKIKRISV